MAFELFDLKNYSKYGELIKKWSREPKSRPKTPEEFGKQMQDAGVEATFDPKKFPGGLEFIDTDANVLSIRLPPAKMIDEAEAKLKAGSYPIPAFYERVFNDGLSIPSEAERLRFHSERVGEYTIQFCG